ncbi:GFA family protein [Rhodobacter sp. Har01]|uniref:GFA family protein n=1 Tax=Rhodobacter sp. Har01 TaxID=2883999 RepID=UPI001D06D5EC|nr:GFA family protein [Rhodobacter sp. Har01]MCB6179828.1 GFA family protein [Rhodobacter sp. Har01]
MAQGSCHCGAVAFRVDGPLRPVIDCHCSQCRKQSGHFWAATSAAHADFHLLRDDGLAWYRASPAARRGFCRHCGSFLFWQPEGEDRLSIAAGCLDGATGLATTESWFHEDAGDYYDPAGGPPPRLAMAPVTLQGACLCGANRFTLPGPMGEVWACHCIQCRKISGHYSASFDARESDVTWQARHLAEYVTPGGGRRGFCPSCATSLFFRAADGAFSVEAGCIANPTGGRISEHIFTSFKGDYYDITDGLPAWPDAGG